MIILISLLFYLNQSNILHVLCITNGLLFIMFSLNIMMLIGNNYGLNMDYQFYRNAV